MSRDSMNGSTDDLSEETTSTSASEAMGAHGHNAHQHRSKKHVHFGRDRRRVSVDTAIAEHGGVFHSSPKGGKLADLLDWLKPSSKSSPSEHAKHRRRSVDCNSSLLINNSSKLLGSTDKSSPLYEHSEEPLHSAAKDYSSPLFLNTKMANSWVENIPQEYLYQRNTHSADNKLPEQQFRDRSSSEAGRYLLLRRSHDQIGRQRNECVGRVEESSKKAYCQLLAHMTCYDVMPQITKMISFDSRLPVRKAFLALINNGIRAAIIVDPTTGTAIGMLTATDLIKILLETALKNSTNLLNLPLHKVLVTGKHYKRAPIALTVTDNLYNATKLLCQMRLHRIIVYDSAETGNALFFLSKKMILQALQKYIALLPLPSCMTATLDHLRIGTWDDVTSVPLTTTVHKATITFLGKNISCLPVVDEKNRVLNVLTKLDLMNLVADEGETETILNKSVHEVVSNKHPGVENLVVCPVNATLLSAVESLLQSNAHRLIVIDAGRRLEGVITVSDLMKFFIENF